MISTRCSWIVLPSGRSLGLMNSVAPNLSATSSLDGLVSIAMTREQFFALAPCRTERPTQPAPKTATVEPSVCEIQVEDDEMKWG